jgi:hypothetical protein
MLHGGTLFSHTAILVPGRPVRRLRRSMAAAGLDDRVGALVVPLCEKRVSLAGMVT